MKKSQLISVVIICITALIITFTVIHFRHRKASDHLILYGNVDVRQVDIGFRVPGQVTELTVEEGDWVETGDLLCTLDTTPYDSELDEAVSAADAIRANLSNAEKLLMRRLELIDSGAVSQEDLDNATANYEQLKANLAEAEAAIVVAQERLSYTKAYAPTEGVILTRIREPGTVVNPADPVYTLSISSPVWIRAFVDEPQLGDIYYGMSAEVFTDGGRRYKGTIGFISPVAEFTPKSVETTQLRTDLVYRLRIYVESPDRGLLQGMPVTVKLYKSSKE